MASVNEKVRLTGKSLANALSKGDVKAAAKWAKRLLALLDPAPLPPVVAPAVAAPAAPDHNPPDFGERPEMSSALYNDWVSAWVQHTFPDAYRDWPPLVYAITPEAIAAAAVRDGCLAQVCAAGTLGHPGGPWDALGDWRLYTALTSTSNEEGGWVHRVWHMGKLVGEKVGDGDDGLEFAESLGFNW